MPLSCLLLPHTVFRAKRNKGSTRISTLWITCQFLAITQIDRNWKKNRRGKSLLIKYTWNQYFVAPGNSGKEGRGFNSNRKGNCILEETVLEWVNSVYLEVV